MLGNMTALDLVTLIVVIVVSLTIHEMMHAFVGHKLGDDTAAEEGRVTLNPLKHIDPLMTVLLPIVTIVLFQTPILAAKPVPFDPRNVKWDEFGAALIGLAGPLSNLVLAMFGVIVALVLQPSGLAIGVLQTFVAVNVMLFVFNMLPIPPLDGSRVVYAFAPDPVRRVFESLEQVGIFIIIGIIIAGGFKFIGRINEMVLNALPFIHSTDLFRLVQ